MRWILSQGYELAVGRGDGSYARRLTRLAKLDLLAIDDWMIAPLRDAERRDVTEVIEDRAEPAATLLRRKPARGAVERSSGCTDAVVLY